MLSPDGQNLQAMIALFTDAGLQGLAAGKSEAVLSPGPLILRFAALLKPLRLVL